MKRISALLLAVCVAGAMNIPAFAAISSNGASRGDPRHGDLVHYADGRDIEKLQSKEISPYKKVYEEGGFRGIGDGEYYGVIYVDVGQTVTLHLAQYSIFEDGDGFATYWGYPSDLTSVKLESTIDKNKADVKYSDLLNYNGDVCWEVKITGVQEGVEEFIYQSPPMEERIYKVVVGSGGSSNKPASASSGEKASSSTPKEEKPGTTQTTTTATGNTYTVQAGDTLATIALNFYGDMNYWPQLQAANATNLARTQNGIIYAGFELHLPGDIGNGIIPAAKAGPGETLYTVQPGDSYGLIAQRHFGDAGRYMEIFNRNSDRLKDINTLFAGQIIVLP